MVEDCPFLVDGPGRKGYHGARDNSFPRDVGE
jgi:hypothetical protein